MPQPCGMQQSRHEESRRRDRVRGQEHPGRQRHGGRRQHCAFEPCRRLEVAPRQGRHREGRDDASGDDALDHDDQCQTRVQRTKRIDAQPSQCRRVKHAVGRREQHQDAPQRKIAAIARLPQHADQFDCHPRQQQGVQHRVHAIRCAQGRQPRREPQTRHGCQSGAARRGQAGPGFAGRQQKTHDDRHRKTKQHLVGMPEQRRHLRR